MSGFHLGIRFEVFVKLAGMRGDLRHLILKLLALLIAVCSVICRPAAENL